MDRVGTQERIGYRVDRDEQMTGIPMELTEFPWEREWESEFDRNGNENYSTGMGIRQFPLEGKK
jgi:hypothetical protein